MPIGKNGFAFPKGKQITASGANIDILLDKIKKVEIQDSISTVNNKDIKKERKYIKF